MPRLFSGIEIPEAARQRLAMLQAGLDGARWVDQANFHITLRFVGDVDGVVAREFSMALAAVEAQPFQLDLDGLGSFGGRRPRAVWAGIRQSDELDGLRRAHERAARRAGLPAEGRNFAPHVTLARLRQCRAANVATYLERNGGFLGPSFRVERFVLFSSRESRGGGPYAIEQIYPLGGGSVQPTA